MGQAEAACAVAAVLWLGALGAEPAARSHCEQGERREAQCRALAGVEPTQWLFAAQLDLNRAAASSLEVLPGIGPARAQAIVAERCRARFERVEEIERVRGIGPSLRAGLAARVKVGPAADQRVGAGCPAARD